MKAPALAALVVIAAGLAVGCSTSYEGSSKADFVTQGNAVCRASGASVKPALDELTERRPPTRAVMRSFAGDVALPGLQERVDKLRQLDPPNEDRKKVDEIIRTYQKGIDEITADPLQLADADPLLNAYIKAGAYGLSACAE